MLSGGLFLSHTRPPFVLCGTLWIFLIAFLTINLPSAYQQLQAAFAPFIPSWKKQAASSAPAGCERYGGSRRHCCAPASSPPVLRLHRVMRDLSAAIILFTSPGSCGRSP